MMKKKYMALALAGLLQTGIALATPITFNFSGDVVDDAYGTGWTSFTGSYTFDSTAIDQIAASNSGSYASLGATFGMSLDFDNGAEVYSLYGLPFGFNVAVTNDFGPAVVDQYMTSADDGSTFMGLMLEDWQSSIFASDQLLTHAFDLSQFEIKDLFLFSSTAEIRGMLTSLTCDLGCIADSNDYDPGGDNNPGANPVPAPGTITLMMAGFMGIAFSRLQKTKPQTV